MRTSHNLTHAWMTLLALIVLASAAFAADPGTRPFPSPDDPPNDQMAGSVLIYNVYTSSAANPNAENTRINITNTSATANAFVHLFFVDGSNCGVADAFLCLTPNQTTSFFASDIDPGVMGYILAMA